MLTVVASDDAVASPTFSGPSAARVERNLVKSYFVTVPEGAKALQVDLAGIATEQPDPLHRLHPYGVPVEDTTTTRAATRTTPTRRPATRRRGRTPTRCPGVWEIEVESRRTSPLLDNPTS